MKDRQLELIAYRNRHVLITGGMGFIGLNLVAGLLGVDAKVRILDVRRPNLVAEFESILNQVQFYHGDLRDNQLAETAISGCEVVFNLAGKSGAMVSNASPLDDLEVNCRGQIAFLESCRRANPSTKIVYPSSRLVYMATETLPVSETAPLKPRSIYGIHKMAAEHYHLLYAHLYGLRTTILRITNPYGPFQQTGRNHYGIVNHFIQLALQDQTLSVYGDGSQLRDYVHISDVIRALLICGVDPRADGQIFNIGGSQPVSFQAMANLVVQMAGAGRVQFMEWPPEAAQVETGSFVADISLISRTIGWYPVTSFEDGLKMTMESYKNLHRPQAMQLSSQKAGDSLI